MSFKVNKYRPQNEDGIIQQSSKPYTQILNTVLQANIDPTCLAVWCSLQSRPNNWKLQVNQLRAQFGLGRDKVYQVLNKLIAYNLLKKVQERNDDGTLGSILYIIQDGNEFNAPFPDLPDTVEPDTANQDLTKERVLTKERKKQNSSANEFAQAWEMFWKAYPVKKNKSRAMTIFKSKKLYKQIDVILKHIEQSTKTDKKWLDGYIPHPSTYLNGKRWEDEIETATGFVQSLSKPCVTNNIIEPLKSYKPISKDVSNSYMKNFKSV